MKKILTILLLAVSVAAWGTKWYISPTGNDTSGDGSIGAPYFELEKVWPYLSAGDTLYLRGGTYQFNDSQGLTGKSGTIGNYINVWAYPGETPILTVSGSYAQNELIDVVGDYLHWKGIDISGFAQRPTDTYAYAAMRFTDSNNCIFERLNYHHNMGGFRIKGASTGNLILNCDFHHIYDPYTSYGDGDGCDIAEVAAGSTNTVRGCRFWRNADDGLDLWGNDGYVIIENCWSWMNGYREDGSTAGGDGAGFKMGVTVTLDSTTFQRTIQNCVAFDNRQFGITQNGALCLHYVYHNTIFRNLYRGIYFSTSWGLSPHVITNNIAYANTTNTVITEAAVLTTNSWQVATVTNDDFVSIDTAGVSGARQADGSLPILTFLHLVDGSDLKDAGTAVGVNTDGDGTTRGYLPDMGAYEIEDIRMLVNSTGGLILNNNKRVTIRR